MKTCSIDDLKENFSFDAETGILTRRFKIGHLAAGEPVGHVSNRGYLLFVFRQRRYAVHRAGFAMYYGRWPNLGLDHINLLKTDNRIANLREATDSQNLANTGLNSRNTSGYKGVCWHKGERRWRAKIEVNGKCMDIGRYRDIEEARIAYQQAVEKYFGDFGRAE